MKTPTRHSGRRLATLAIALALTLPVQGADFQMTPGGTSWIEASSSLCDGDCFGAEKRMPTADYSLKPGRSFIAGGEVSPGGVSLLNSGGVSGKFVWGATGGLFMVHGSGIVPVPVTATLRVTGDVRKSSAQLTSGSATWRIGEWRSENVTSDLNQRVWGNVGDGVGYGFGVAGAAFDRELTYAFTATPGQAFNLGYQLTTNTQSASTIEVVTVTAQASFSLQVGAGYFVTGENGYDSRVSAVPEPAAYALLLAGLALTGGIARRGGRAARAMTAGAPLPRSPLEH